MNKKLMPCDCCGAPYMQRLNRGGEITNKGTPLKFVRCDVCRQTCRANLIDGRLVHRKAAP